MPRLEDTPTHFKGKDALGHVIEAQAQGIISAAEVHGMEVPGHLSAACDAARESTVMLTLIWILLLFLHIPHSLTLLLMSLFTIGYLLWKMGRSAWLGWFRLERLHRVLEQERWEIEHHRQQERDELRVLYAAKGFEGKLLEDVLDVLMADNDRLLKVMVEEELGLTLSTHEHPLKQGMGAAIGVILGGALCIISTSLWPEQGIWIGATLAISIAAAMSAHFARNKLIPSIVWNLGLATLACGSLYFLLEYV